MALDAKSVLKQLDSLREYLAVEASKEMDAEEEGESLAHEMAETPEEEAAEHAPGGEEEYGERGPPKGGLAVVIDMKPKRPGIGGKVPGCPDCADGTPHEHVGK